MTTRLVFPVGIVLVALWFFMSASVVLQDHAVVQHGEPEVSRVRQAMEVKAQDKTWWNRPPCKDGRYRYTLYLGDGEWAVWVLEKTAQGAMKEITAFTTTDQTYVKNVHDACGNGDWMGHSYGN